MVSFFLIFAEFGRAIAKTVRDPETRGIAVVAALVLLVGTIFYSAVEGWSLLDSLYFCVVTLATVGFGDLYPVTVAGKAFTIVYVLSGVGILVLLATQVASVVVAEHAERLAHLRERRSGAPAAEHEPADVVPAEDRTDSLA